MKKQIFVKDITRENLEVSDLFIVAKKGVFSTKTNSKYIAVTLKDKTGTIEGKIWERADEFGSLFEKNDLVRVVSRSKLYQERPQLTISNIRKVEESISAADMTAFFPGGDRSGEELQREYFSMVEAIENLHLKALLTLFGTKKDKLERFFCLPASVGVHHTYIGGLLDHSLSMARMGVEVSRSLKADRDIVVVGSLLHDIGKIDEIYIEGGFHYSDKGRLLGHISMGLLTVQTLIAELKEFPSWIADVLSHIIISHHGIEEWGSPRKPMCIEAIIVHYLDNLDAKVMGVKEHMRDNMEDENWSEWHRLYESRFFKLPER